MRLWIVRVCLLAACSHFLGTALRTGWHGLSTDFPNYYTAAVLVRQGKPLRDFYDWSWFARQMNYAGIEHQLGAYTPQTPVTMLPMVALAGMPPLAAKRAWLAFNLALLLAVVWMLTRVTGIRWEYLALLLFAGHAALASNFVYGQYYVFLLFLLTLTYYTLHHGEGAAAGVVTGVAFALKLYTGPLLLYYAVKRKWSVVAGMLAGAAALGVLALLLFGASDVLYYLTRVLPRTLEGASIDPYHPGVPALTTILRRLLMSEPALHPHPPLDAPWLFFFARTAVQLGLLVFPLLAIARANRPDYRPEFAWLSIALVLLSTSTASYTFVLLFLPIALLLPGASPAKAAYLAASYILLCTGLRAEWLFPKVWLLLLLYAIAGAEFWRRLRVPYIVTVAAAVLALAAGDAALRFSAWRQEPGRRFAQIAVEPQALFANYPAISRFGLFYQGMGDIRQGEPGYVLRWQHGDRIDRLAFAGYALEPWAPDPQGPVRFELVAGGASHFLQFDPAAGTVSPASPLPSPAVRRAVSPDGKWIAYTRETLFSQQLWLENVTTREGQLLAGGHCNSGSPAWELDSSAVVFASDCGRAFGLPALYRGPVAAP